MIRKILLYIRDFINKLLKEPTPYNTITFNVGTHTTTGIILGTTDNTFCNNTITTAAGSGIYLNGSNDY